MFGGLDVPDDLSNDYLQHQYDAGARIQTNSWGVPYGNQYSSTARHFDSFSFINQDFVALVATGNSDFHRGSTGSMGSPATAKNVISVGASVNTDEFWRVGIAGMTGRPANYYKCNDFTGSNSDGPCQDNLAPFTSGGPTYDHRIAPDVVAPGKWGLCVF
jgi:serine protease AprX